MPRSSPKDREYLEPHNGKWRVVVSVPRSLHGELPTKLKRALGTDSLAVANALKWTVVADLKRQIEEALGKSGQDPLSREALALLRARQEARTPEELDGIEAALDIRLDEIAGRFHTVSDPFRGEQEEPVDPERFQRALAFRDAATGKATPLSEHHATYMDQLRVKPRTRADDERALRYLETWCQREGIPRTLQAIDKRTATRFMDGLGSIAAGRSNVTLQKYLNRLRIYWKWLEKRDLVDRNVWAGLTLPKDTAGYEEVERPFTDEEMVKLFSGPAPERLRDVMLIGALTGCRVDPIVCLRVKDCEGGNFLFKPQKRETKERLVPIHSELKAMVERRTAGKSPDDPLFPEWPAPASNSLRERSFKAVNAFTDYRRSVGVDHRVPGKRRSLVNFHSFRRWFITQAERAGQPEHIIAAVVGHKRLGMTLGRYSGGPAIEQARACVEAVRLPSALTVEGD